MKRSVFLRISLFSFLLCQTASAIHLGATADGKPLPWCQKMAHPLDQVVNDKCPETPFLMNLGPTGIRAMITPEDPKAFKVMFVFQDSKSPAKGLINPGDMIVGANGKEFKNPHGFHRKKAGSRGWQGPPFELAQAIEDSQGKDGKLELIVLPKGRKSFKNKVTIQLKPVGRFSPTYPWNCPRSDKLLKDLLDFVFEDGVPKGRPTTIQCLLSLWASGDKRAIPLIKSQAESLMRGRRSPSEGGMVTWMWGYQGIFLGEYYNAFKDKGVMGAVEALNDCFELGMDYGAGCFSHRPYPAIQRRIAEGGPKGYGAMAATGGLAMLAMSIFKQTGLPYADRPYQRIHQAYLGGAGQSASGAIAYGFGCGWKSCQIRLNSGAGQCKSKEGVGYLCPTGLKGTTFEVEDWYQESDGWKEKLVPPTGKYSWLKSDADKLLVYESGYYLDSPPVNRPESKGKSVQQRRVFQPRTWPEPSGPIPNNHKGGGHNAPVGMGALAHYIGNKGNTSWNYLGKHLATCCASSPKTTWDGHACAEMHAFFNILGASRADEKDFRSFLDYYKTLIILSETHDGKGLVEQPFGCQRNSTCSVARNRKIYTYATILLLSIPKHKLLITGADYEQPAPPTTAKLHTSSSSYSSSSTPAPPPPKPVRAARTLSNTNKEILDRSLRHTLAKMSEGGKLKPVPMNISLTSKLVTLVSAKDDGHLTFKTVQGGQTASITWAKLTAIDRVNLAILASTLRPESTDAKALVGVYMESIGRVEDADKYFKMAGDASCKKLEALFD